MDVERLYIFGFLRVLCYRVKLAHAPLWIIYPYAFPVPIPDHLDGPTTLVPVSHAESSTSCAGSP
jgi:hypothetical protein